MTGRKLFPARDAAAVEGWWVRHPEGNFYTQVKLSGSMAYVTFRMEDPPSNPHPLYGETVDQEVPQKFVDAINRAIETVLYHEKRGWIVREEPRRA